MFTTLGLFIICIILYLWKKTTDMNYWQRKGVPFLKQLPLFGNTLPSLLLQKTAGDLMRELYFQSSDPFFGIWTFNQPQLFVKCPHLIKQMLVKDFNYFSDRYIYADEFSANMLFFMANPKWKLVRSKTTPMFSISKMKSIFPEMQSISKNMVEYINTISNKNSINVCDIFVKFTTQVAYSTAFGLDSKSFQNKDTPFVSVVKNVFTLSVSDLIYCILYCYRNFLNKFIKFKVIESSVEEFLKGVFSDIEETRILEKVQRGDVMDFLIKLKNENNLGQTEIVAQMAQFLLAGYDTTNTIISLALYEISLNKHIQDKLREEIWANLDNNGDVSYNSLNTMKYLDKVVCETMRKYPVIPFLERTCTKNYRIPNTAVTIEKGVEIIISASGLHHDPKYYPQPELFDPERFSVENIQKRHPYSYLPFGKGPRRCIGERLGLMLVKLGIVHVVKNFEINICKETNVPLQFDPRKYNLSVAGGVYVQFVKLN